jgi:hypothetical protein
MTERPRFLTMKETKLHFNKEQKLPGKACNAKNIRCDFTSIKMYRSVAQE